MAKISTLVDPFSGAALLGNWAFRGTYNSITVSGGNVTVVTTTGFTEGGFEDATGYDWTLSDFIVKVTSASGNGIRFSVRLVSGDPNFYPGIARTDSAWLSQFGRFSTGFSGSGSATTGNLYGRIRRTATDWEFAHSADGVTWTTFDTQPIATWPADVTSQGVMVLGLSSASETFVVDQIGVASAPTVARSVFPFFLG